MRSAAFLYRLPATKPNLMSYKNNLQPAGKLSLLRSFRKKLLISFIALLIFGGSGFAQPTSDTEYYRAPFSAVAPTIDGIANEEIWQDAAWVSIAQLYLGTAPSATDFTGRYKIVWTSSRLYVLTEITDNLLSDDHADPLTNWWDDDCVEIFLDENKSGGIHQYNYNAFAYHVSASDYHVVDIGTDQNPHLYDDHVTTKWTKNGNVYTWEIEIKEFPDTYVYGGTSIQPVTLTLGKKSGFNIAYCDNDETTGRESFIGSRFLQAADRDRGYIDASIFATVELVNSTAKKISSFKFNSPVATGVITGTNIAITLPAGTNVTNLVATFTNSLSSSVKVGSNTQVSGTTANNFTNPVTYTVTAQDGTTANYTVTVTVTNNATNIAQGKPATASSNETTAMVAGNAVDGNNTTRWSSLFSDSQWIYVDLGGSYSINRVNLIWEGAYGRDYKIQTSPDASAWTDIKTVIGNTTLSNDWTGLNGTGRYVRMLGTARGTVYGYSLFEMQVYGTPVSGNLAPNASIITPVNNSSFTSPATVNLAANASDADGTIVKVEFFHSGSTFIGQSASTVNPYNFTWSNVAAGTYTITCKATDNLGLTKISDPVMIVVNLPPTGNIAKGKPAIASSSETASTGPLNAVDGVAATRWSSLFSDPQWIYVDLGGNFNVNRVKLVWEAAYGKDYKIQVSGSTNGPWTDIKTVTGNTTLTNDWTSLSGTGRYVRVSGTARGTVYGYSLYEFEVYGTAAARAATPENVEANDGEVISFFPNPVTDIVHLEGVEDGNDIIIHNTIGTAQRFKVQNKSIDVRDLSEGVYIIQLSKRKNKILIKK
jgi:hypothetical protein